MAAYNGGKFIDIQLSSILSQLEPQDEVLIVDDCSTDDTAARVRALNDSRIRLIEHHANKGVVATFEEALRQASGEILFLSDDDDIWACNKVNRFLAAFRDCPDVQIVISRVQLIDDMGIPFANDRITRKGEFVSGFWKNVYKNHYQGSAMAIRASLRERVLPFPTHPPFLHDVWIGTRNAATGGKSAFIAEDLLFYRRHSHNLSRTLSLRERLRWRAALLWNHATYALRARLLPATWTAAPPRDAVIHE